MWRAGGQIRQASWQVDWFDKSQKSGLLPQGIRDNLRNAGSEAGVQVVCIQLSLDELMFNRYVVQEWQRQRGTGCRQAARRVADINISGGRHTGNTRMQGKTGHIRTGGGDTSILNVYFFWGAVGTLWWCFCPRRCMGVSCDETLYPILSFRNNKTEAH